ncbi:MAG: hypothetical protein A2452_08995 [Candidatus Firestonebacteria bacterium RIFOXYC2_FULL_39_67]|nr:MAG: hypothetical protein A2536_09505 [Candidatus Firestonebacteria bacterium RIFOXYD2_FULL_39_29]OGF53586.1 MAG: hypothetical protein A2452_08995 [Candidatus Firestonebacteria bacterium RIFOXYC2_FULL_39_67]
MTDFNITEYLSKYKPHNSMQIVPRAVPYFSFYSLRLLECPYRYKMMVILRDPLSKMQDFRNALSGSVVHGLAEMFLKGRYKDLSWLKENTLPLFNKIISEVPVLIWRGDPEEDKATVLTHINQMVDYLIQYFKDIKLLESAKIFPEHTFKTLIAGELKVNPLAISGRVDLITVSKDGFVDIYDFKCVNIISEEGLSKLQFLFYFVGILGMDIGRIRSLRFILPALKMDLQIKFSSKDLENFIKQIKLAYKEVAQCHKTGFFAKPGRQCGFCMYKTGECDKYKLLNLKPSYFNK